MEIPRLFSVPARQVPLLTLRGRLILGVVVPLLGFLAILGGFLVNRAGSILESQLKEEVELIARTLERPVSYSLERQREGSLQDALEAAFHFDRVYGAYLYNSEGQPIARAGGRTVRGNDSRDISDFARPRGTRDFRGAEEEAQLFSYMVPLTSHQGESLGLLQVTRDSREMEARIGELRSRFFTGYAVFAVALVSLLLTSNRFSTERPLRRLNATMNRIREGKEGERAEVQGAREIGELASSLNRMLDSLEKQHEEIRTHTQTRRHLLQRLEHSEKMAVLGEMAGSIGHEIGTPLATMDGHAQRALRVAKDHQTVETLHAIRREVQAVSEFVHQLLSFGRGPRSDHRHGRVHPLFHAGIEQAETVAGASVQRRELESAARAVPVRGDPVRLELAWKNVVLNALQSRARARVHCHGTLQGQRLVLTTDDDGPGVPEEQREVLFEPFHTTRPGGEGSGLGLALVDRIMNEHGGAVLIEDSPLGGARFQLILPLDRPPHS